MGKRKINYYNLSQFLINGFLLAIVIYYAGVYGISDLVLKGDSRHEIILNITIWYVLAMACLDRTFENLRKINEDS